MQLNFLNRTKSFLIEAILCMVKVNI